MNRTNVGMVQSRGGTSFALESFQRLAVFRQFLRKEFEGDQAAQSGVFGLVDDAHAPAAELFEDAVVRKGFPEECLRVRHSLQILGAGVGQVNEDTKTRRHEDTKTRRRPIAVQLHATEVRKEIR